MESLVQEHPPSFGAECHGRSFLHLDPPSDWEDGTIPHHPPSATSTSTSSTDRSDRSSFLLFPTAPRTLRKPSTVRKPKPRRVDHLTMPLPLFGNLSRKPTSPVSALPIDHAVSFLPFESSPTSSFVIDRKRTRKHSKPAALSHANANQVVPSLPLSPSSPTTPGRGTYYTNGQSLTPKTTSHNPRPSISFPSSTTRLSSNPTTASARLGYAVPPSPLEPFPSIIGVFDSVPSGKEGPIGLGLGNVEAAGSRARPISPQTHTTSHQEDHSAARLKKERRATLKLPMMNPPPKESNRMTCTEADEEWDIVSVRSAFSAPRAPPSIQSRHSSRSLGRQPQLIAPRPKHGTLKEWAHPNDSRLANGAELGAAEVLEHLSGHLLKGGWADEQDESAPAGATNRQNDSSDGLPDHRDTYPTRTQGRDSDSMTSSRRDLDDTGSMRSWREARKKSKPPSLRPLSEQPSTGHRASPSHSRSPPPPPLDRLKVQEVLTTSREPERPLPPSRTTSLTPVLGFPSPPERTPIHGNLELEDLHDDLEFTMMQASISMPARQRSVVRKVSAGWSRKGGQSKETRSYGEGGLVERKNRMKVPLMLDLRSPRADSVRSGPQSSTSLEPIHQRPLPPVPLLSISNQAPTPTRTYSTGAAALLGSKLTILRAKRPQTSPNGKSGSISGIAINREVNISEALPETATIPSLNRSARPTRLSPRDEPHPMSPRMIGLDPIDITGRREGITALSFLAMEDPYPSNSRPHSILGSENQHDDDDPAVLGRSVSPVVGHILPPNELRRIFSETRERRRSSMSSASTASHHAGGLSTATLVGEFHVSDARTVERKIASQEADGFSLLEALELQESDDSEDFPEHLKPKRKSLDLRRPSLKHLTISPAFDPFPPVSSSRDTYLSRPRTPTQDHDVEPIMPTSLSPPPRPRQSTSSRRDSSSKILLTYGRKLDPLRDGHGVMAPPGISMSTPPIPETPSTSARTLLDLEAMSRPQTFLGTGTNPKSTPMDTLDAETDGINAVDGQLERRREDSFGAEMMIRSDTMGTPPSCLDISPRTPASSTMPMTPLAASPFTPMSPSPGPGPSCPSAMSAMSNLDEDDARQLASYSFPAKPSSASSSTARSGRAVIAKASELPAETPEYSINGDHMGHRPTSDDSKLAEPSHDNEMTESHSSGSRSASTSVSSRAIDREQALREWLMSKPKRVAVGGLVA